MDKKSIQKIIEKVKIKKESKNNDAKEKIANLIDTINEELEKFILR